MADLIGVDLHGDRGDQDWSRWKRAGASYVSVKATEGATFTDKRFTAGRLKAIEDAGLIFIGPYSFGYPESNSDWKAEADHYLKVCDKAGVDWDKTWPIQDIERDGRNSAEGEWVRNWCRYVAEQTGRDKFAIPGLVYAGYYFWRSAAGNAAPPKDWGLWRPWYGRSTWPPADPWSNNLLLFWQDSSTWDGIDRGNWDRNRFRGTEKELKGLIKAKSGKQPKVGWVK